MTDDDERRMRAHILMRRSQSVTPERDPKYDFSAVGREHDPRVSFTVETPSGLLVQISGAMSSFGDLSVEDVVGPVVELVEKLRKPKD
jgi:hypothetical protein